MPVVASAFVSMGIDLRAAIRTCSNFITFTLALVGAVLAAPSVPQYGYTPPPSYQDSPKYDFNYAVKHDYSGNDFGHQETRDGYNTQGSYSVLLPDGRLQTVTYTVNGDSGYVAQVSYEGEAQYPHYEPAPYHPTPAPYRPTPAPYHPTPAPYHPTPSRYH
ncbi:larval cuticle protein A3A-like [Oratosquilla oratoria]|uniref:larval cuticle protein A3A-like n=1 Tax=Oratosquilla oratoria TaxID=337810 RepID=UPI003F763455